MLTSLFALALGSTASAALGDLFVDAAANCSSADGTAALPYCTIGEALLASQDGDVIHVVPGTYPEELNVTTDVQLVPTGAFGSVVVDGESVRGLLTVEAGAAAEFSRFDFTRGNGISSGNQGLVINRGALTLRNSSISNANTNGCCSRSVIRDDFTSQGLTLEYCSIRGNDINGSSAALIRSYGSAGLTMRYSSIVSNYVYVGPTLKVGAGTMIIEGCYFQSSSPQAGAVIDARDADLTLRNTTITNTRAVALRIHGDGGSQLIENCTLMNNGPLIAAAIFVDGTSLPRVRGSVLGAGTLVGNTGSVGGDFVSLGYNVVERVGPTSSGFVDGVMGDQVGSITQPLDPMLAPAANNGGPTRSRMPLPGSPAIDAGHPTDFPAHDQNGFPRTFGGSDAGSVELPLGLDSPCPAAANSTGAIARMRITGSGDPSRNAIELRVDRVPPGMTGLFLVSGVDGFVPFAGGSSGTLCLGGSIGRFVGPGQVQSSSAEGQLQLQVDLTAIPQGIGTVPTMAGQYWVFQSWFRDSFGSFATSNFSSARGITF